MTAPSAPYMQLAPFVASGDASKQFNRCSFWDTNTEAVMRRKICYETNPIPNARRRLAEIHAAEAEAEAERAKETGGGVVKGSAREREAAAAQGSGIEEL